MNRSTHTVRSVLLLVSLSISAGAQEKIFRYNLPPVEGVKGLTSEIVGGADACVILKDHVYLEGPHSRYTGTTIILTNEVTSASETIIAKLFTQAAVETFGSYTIDFATGGGDAEDQKFEAKARVMKPDGTISVMPDDAVTIVDGIKTGKGKVLTRRALFKIPDLQPNQIVQIEHTIITPYSPTLRRSFYYHTAYPTLQSNLTILMPKKEKVTFMHFPSNVFGPAVVREEGKFISSMWTVKNLNAIPTEVYGHPFADLSYLTMIVPNEEDEDEEDRGWNQLAKVYLKYSVNPGSVSGSFVEDLGLVDEGPATWDNIMKLYTALRKMFTLTATNSPYPASSRIDDIIDEKEGDASDIAYLMLKVLDRWDQPSTPVLIRDRREGIYESSVSTFGWFDRMGLKVTLDGATIVFDFDRSLPTTFENPWYLDGARVLVLADTGVTHLPIGLPIKMPDITSRELHRIDLMGDGTSNDAVSITLKGAVAQRLRAELYELRGKELEDEARKILESNVLREADSATFNAFLDAREIELTGGGKSRATSAVIDSIMTFQPRGHLLRTFRGKFPLTRRRGDVILDQQFAMMSEWSIRVPEGYRVERMMPPAAIPSPAGMTSSVSYMQTGDRYVVKSDVLIRSKTVPPEHYEFFLKFLDGAIQSMERDVVFVKERVE